MSGGSDSDPGGSDFWGIVSASANIKMITINEGDSGTVFPDANIGYDTFRFRAPSAATAAPEPRTLTLLCLGGMLALTRRRKGGNQ